MASRAAMEIDPSYRLLLAVRSGDLETSTELLNKYDLGYSPSWSQGYNLLREALQHDQEEIAKLLMLRGAKVNSKSKRQSETPLHLAVMNEYEQIVEMLLSKEANVNAKNHSDETPLHCAVERGHLKIVESLLKKKANVEARSRYGTTPLHKAVQSGDAHITMLLLAHGANINATCTSSWKQGNTALHYAASQGNATLVDLLLNKGADINANAKYMLTPLHVASDMNRDKVVKLLLERGANVDKRDKNGKTILCLAVEKGNSTLVELILEAKPDMRNKDNRNCLYTAIHGSIGTAESRIVEVLLAYGFGVNSKDAKDPNLLHAVVEKGYVKIVEDLLKFGANVDEPHELKKGWTLLHTAVIHHKIEIVRLLIKNNANINAKDENGKSPLYCAIEVSDAEIAMLLLDEGANAKGRPNILHAAVKTVRKDLVDMILRRVPKINVNTHEKFGVTALYCTIVDGVLDLVRSNKEATDVDIAKRDIVRILFENGARVNDQTKNGVTALHAAAARGYEKVVELLLKRNANVNAFDKRNSTPLHEAAMEGNKTIVKMLLDRGAIVNVMRMDGISPLNLAIRRGNAHIIKLLVDRGADIAYKNKDGVTSLHIAAAYDNPDTVEILLTSFEDVDCRDRNARTALHIASKHGTLSVVNLLLDHDSDINATCNDGKTPLDYATMGTYSERYGNGPFILQFDWGQLMSGDDYDDYYHSHWDYSDNEIENSYNYFDDDDFNDSSSMISDRPYEEVAEILEKHIVKMIALNRYVTDKNLKAVDIFKDHRILFDNCKLEIEIMKNHKIADSNVSFYDILTKGMYQLALYARNKNIVDALVTGHHRDVFEFYSGMVDSRFKKGQKRDGLLDASLKSLSSLSGYALPDLSTIELFNYLTNGDLENLIKAGLNDELDS